MSGSSASFWWASTRSIRVRAPSPTKPLTRSRGSGSLAGARRASAAFTELAMSPAESTSVPSRSKTTSRATLAGADVAERAQPLARRRVELADRAAGRQRQPQADRRHARLRRAEEAQAAIAVGLGLDVREPVG